MRLHNLFIDHDIWEDYWREFALARPRACGGCDDIRTIRAAADGEATPNWTDPQSLSLSGKIDAAIEGKA